MAAENIEILRHFWDEIGGATRLDDSASLERLLALISPEVEIRRAPHPEAQVLHGHEGLARASAEWQEMLDDIEVKLDRLIDAGDKTVAVTRWSGIGKGSGAPFEVPVIDVLAWERGKVVRWDVYTNLADALRDIGLSE